MPLALSRRLFILKVPRLKDFGVLNNLSDGKAAYGSRFRLS
jgi:hypothetical protein